MVRRALEDKADPTAIAKLFQTGPQKRPRRTPARRQRSGAGHPSLEGDHVMPVLLEQVLEQLETRQQADGSYKAFCPAHDDGATNPNGRSLHITPVGENSATLHCFAGCEFADILEALRLNTTNTTNIASKGPRKPRKQSFEVKSPDGEV